MTDASQAVESPESSSSGPIPAPAPATAALPDEDSAAPPPAAPSTNVTRLRRLLDLARPEWLPLAAGTFFLIIGSSMGLAYPQAVRIFLDKALLEGDLGMIDSATLIIIAVFGIQAVATALRYYLFTLAGERIVTQLRDDLYRRILDQEIGFFDARRTGELTNRLSSDTGVLQNSVSVNISMALRSAATVVGGLGLLIYTSAALTLLMVAVVPPIVLGAVVSGRFVRRFSRELQDALAKAGEVAEETISGIRTVRAFAQEDRERQRYGNAVRHALGFAQKRIRFVAWFQGIVSFAGFGSLAIVLWYGGRLVIRGEMSVGEVTAFMLYTGIVAVALGTLASLWTDFMRAVGASDRVFDLLDRFPQIPPRGGRTPEKVKGHVRFSAVRFTYPTRPDITVLEGIDLEIRPGERVALVGPSGGGKSTIANLIPRFYDPEGGDIRIDGVNVRQLDPMWLRRQIGIVAQEPILFSTSIADNIAYGRFDPNNNGGSADVRAVADDAIESAAITANAHAFILSFPERYDTLVGERGVQLSGGQKQRIAIARAVLRDPRILILDEATSALDAESEHLVKDALDRLMVGRTTLVIAHRLSTVMGADRVLVVDGGRIVQSGPHAELMQDANGLYRRLVEHQFVQA